VATWLNEYGDVFGVQQESNKGESQAQNPALQAQKRINDVVSTGTPPGVDEDSMSKILGAKSAAELSALLGVSVQ